jgi:hypothetical protein
MAEHIPFVTSEDACSLVQSLYQDAEIVRVPLDRADRLVGLLPNGPKIWLDPTVDGLHDLDTRRSRPDWANPWFDYISSIPSVKRIADPAFQAKPVVSDVHSFARALLDRCVAHKPAWITVPQLPLVNGNERNKINRALASEAGKWKSHAGFKGTFILPLVFTHQDQVNGKTQRNPKIQQAERCYHDAQADGFWVVDNDLRDESGSKTLRNTRFPAIVCLHQELNERIPSKIRIAGPYWGMNLVLWARDLVDYPAIGIGLGYQYSLAGGPSRPAAPRLALSPLRRRTGVGQLKPWLDQVLSKLGPSHPAYTRFDYLRRNLSLLKAPPRAREQVAKFYKKWFDSIAAAPKTGRSMALFQDLSAAYALGKTLPDLDHSEGTARRPEAVVEPLMLSCL